MTETPEAKKSRVGYGPLAAILVVILTYFLSQVFAGVILGVGATMFGYDAETVLKDLESSVVLQFIYIGIVELITVAAIWQFMKHRSIPLKAIGLGRKPSVSDIGPSLIIFVLYFGVLIVVTSLITKYFPAINVEQEQKIGFESAKSAWQLVLVFASLVILPPIVEEITVRGFLYTGLRAKCTKVVAAIIASLVFGVAHLQIGLGDAPLWIAAIDTALLSLFLIYLREKTGALWAGMLVHGMKNGLAFFVLFIVGR